MALAKKCDSCKKFFDFIDNQDNVNGITFAHFDSSGKQQNTITKKELCPSCINSLESIINKGE